MAQNEVDEYAIFGMLSHPTRSAIVTSLYENTELSYTKLMNILNINTGQLNFHLRNMNKLHLYERADGKYRLTGLGRFTYQVLKETKRCIRQEAPVSKNQASLSRRAKAMLIDYSLFFVGPLLTMYLFSFRASFYTWNPMLTSLFLYLIFFSAFISFTFMEAMGGQTIGKYISKIKVVRDEEGDVNLIESAIRNLAKVYLLPVDFLMGIFLFRGEGCLRFVDRFLKLRVIDVSEKHFCKKKLHL